jgi:hypothetical protein
VDVQPLLASAPRTPTSTGGALREFRVEFRDADYKLLNVYNVRPSETETLEGQTLGFFGLLTFFKPRPRSPSIFINEFNPSRL